MSTSRDLSSEGGCDKLGRGNPGPSSSVPDWLTPFLVASLAILLLNLALLGQRRRERRSRWDRRLSRELRAWDGRVPDELSRPRPPG